MTVVLADLETAAALARAHVALDAAAVLLAACKADLPPLPSGPTTTGTSP